MLVREEAARWVSNLSGDERLAMAFDRIERAPTGENCSALGVDQQKSMEIESSPGGQVREREPLMRSTRTLLHWYASSAVHSD